MPRRATDRRLIRRLALEMLLGVALLAAPGSARGQVPADSATAADAEHRARAILELDLRWARLVDRPGFLAGGRALVSILPGLWLGGGGYRVLKAVDDAPERTGPERTLSLGYGGITAELEIPQAPVPVQARVLVGAGVATLRDLVVGTTVGSETLGIVEPGLAVEVFRTGPVALDVSLGYRIVYQVEGPGRIRGSDLTTPWLTVGLRLGGG